MVAQPEYASLYMTVRGSSYIQQGYRPRQQGSPLDARSDPTEEGTSYAANGDGESMPRHRKPSEGKRILLPTNARCSGAKNTFRSFGRRLSAGWSQNFCFSSNRV